MAIPVRARTVISILGLALPHQHESLGTTVFQIAGLDSSLRALQSLEGLAASSFCICVLDENIDEHTRVIAGKKTRWSPASHHSVINGMIHQLNISDNSQSWTSTRHSPAPLSVGPRAAGKARQI